jgi:hypothetical protein
MPYRPSLGTWRSSLFRFDRELPERVSRLLGLRDGSKVPALD